MKIFGLIGYPLAHSFSKKYFGEKFRTEHITDAGFELFPLEHISEFPALLSQNPLLHGLAVTIPHKEAVIPFLHETTDAVKQIGAVNCIQFSGGKTIGHNTDVIGFESSFLPLLKPHQTKALVLGTGGASKAVQYILTKHAIDFLLVSRNGRNRKKTISYEDVDAGIMQDHLVIINCTPVGMTPHEAESPAIPYELLTTDHLLYDLVYKPAKTRFLAEGEKRGSTIKSGFEMLQIQAEENWRIWNAEVS